MIGENMREQVHPAIIACEIMNRADIKGREVDAYAQTYNWLQAMLSGELVVLTKAEFETLTEGDTQPPEPPGIMVPPEDLDESLEEVE